MFIGTLIAGFVDAFVPCACDGANASAQYKPRGWPQCCFGRGVSPCVNAGWYR